LIAWQKARELIRQVCRATRQEQFAADFRLAAQIQSAAVSVMSNIAEGFERNSPGEFQQFLKVSKGSCGETRSLLYVALDNGFVDQQTFESLRARIDELSRIVGGLHASVIRRRINTTRQRPRR
jgi:four helix bundle protein